MLLRELEAADAEHKALHTQLRALEAAAAAALESTASELERRFEERAAAASEVLWENVHHTSTPRPPARAFLSTEVAHFNYPLPPHPPSSLVQVARLEAERRKLLKGLGLAHDAQREAGDGWQLAAAEAAARREKQREQARLYARGSWRPNPSDLHLSCTGPS